MAVSAQARKSEYERLQAIQKGTGKVNALFDARQPQYDDFLQALRDRSSAALGDEKRDIDRQTTFDVARRGVTKGSSDLDARRRNQRSFIQALIGGENRAQGAVARLRSSDEASRRNLMNLIYGGLDASTARQRADQSAQANLQSALDDSMSNAIGGAISTGANIYNYGQQRQEYRRGQQSARSQLYGDI